MLIVLWLGMRKEIIQWVKSCFDCIKVHNTTHVSCQLVHSWPLLTPFSIISADIWSPGDVTSPTGTKCILNCMCNMCQFVVSAALLFVNSVELARSFTENVLLILGLCVIIIVDSDSKFKAIFVQMSKSLLIFIHCVSKRNHKAVGVKKYHCF